MIIFSLLPLILFLFFFLLNKNKNKNSNKIEITNINNVQNNNSITYYKDKNLNNNVNVVDKQKKQSSSFELTLNIGVFLIILSSIIFATTTWNSSNGMFKVIILFLETILFLVLGLVLKHVFKVSKTGNALTFISSILLSSTFLSMGYFKVFGTSFSLFGNYKYLFIGATFFVCFITFFIRKKLIKSEKYFIPLTCFLSFVYFLIMQISNDVIFSFSMISVILLLISLLKQELFKNKEEFNILNITLMIVLTIIYFNSCIYELVSQNTLFLNRIPLMILLISLSSNFIMTGDLKNKTYGILSIIYEMVLTLWFVMFSGSLFTSSIVFIISSLVLYFVHYLSKKEYLCITTLIISYIQAFIGLILICFDKEHVLLAPIISFVYVILTIISLMKNNGLKVINIIFQPIYLSLFALGILIQPQIIKAIKPVDIIMIVNIILIIAMIISSILKNKIKNGYFILVLIGLFIQITCSYYTNLVYSIVALIMNAILIVYSYVSKDEFYKKGSFVLSLLFIINSLIGLNKYYLICSLVIFISIIIFMYLYKMDKRKFVFLSLLSIPIIIVLNNVGLRLLIAKDISLLVAISSVIIFTRKVISDTDEVGMCILELFVLTPMLFSIYNNIFDIIFIIILYVIMYLLSLRNERSSKIYLNYLLFLTPVLFAKLDYSNYEALYIIAFICINVINQVLYRILFDKRHITLDAFNVIISFGLMVGLIDKLDFGNLLSALISLVLIIITYLIHDNERIKYLVSCLLVYPVSLLINYISISEVSDILKTFIWIYPVHIFIRKIFNLEDKACDILEIIIISLTYLVFIFNINIYVAITLGIISILFIVLGTILKHKSFSYVGYVSLILIIIIQTIDLWSKLPWWIYLLVSGIILVVVAAIKESKKK